MNARNLKITVTGDTSDVAKKLKALTKDAGEAGVSITKMASSSSEEGKKLAVVLTLVAKGIRDLKNFQIAQAGKVDKSTYSADKGALVAQRAKRISAQDKLRQQQAKRIAAQERRIAAVEAKRIAAQEKRIAVATARRRARQETIRLKKVRTAMNARVALAKEESAKVLAAVKAGSERRKNAEQSAEAKILNIKALAASREKQIYARLQKDLATISANRKRGRIVGYSATRAQEAATKRLNNLHAKTGRLLQRQATIQDKIASRHKGLIRHVAEVVGAYRLVNSAINTIINSIKAIPNLGIERLTTEAVFTSTFGSAAGSAVAFKALDEEAKRTGISIKTLRDNFRNLHASMSLAGESSQTALEVFRDLNTVSVALHLPAGKIQDLFRAVAQIFNKSKLQAEELVKQLGNVIPGAFAAFADSMGVTTEELTSLMERGLVSAHKTVKGFASYLAETFTEGFRIASTGLKFYLGRMDTSFVHLGETLYDFSEGAMLSVVQSITSGTVALTEMLQSLPQLGYIFKAIGTALVSGGVIAYLVKLQASISKTAQIFSLSFSAAALRGIQGFFAGLIPLLTNPVFLLTALAGALAGIWSYKTKLDEATTSLGDFLYAQDQLQNKLASADLSLEIRVEFDPAVVRIKEQIAELRRAMVEDMPHFTKYEWGRKGTRNFGFKPRPQAEEKYLARAKEQGSTLASQGYDASDLRENADTGRKALSKINKAALEWHLVIEANEKVKKKALTEIALSDKAAQDRADALEDTRRNKAQREAARVARQSTEAEIVLLHLEGKRLAAAKLAFERDNALAESKLQDKTQTGLLKRFKASKSQRWQNRVDEVNSKEAGTLTRNLDAERNAAVTTLSSKTKKIQAEQLAGLHTEREARASILRLNQETVTSLASSLETSRQIAREGTENMKLSPEVAASYKKAEDSLVSLKEKLAEQVGEALTPIEEFALQAKETITNSLGNAFADFILGAKTAGEAIVDFGKSVVAAIARIAAQELAVQIIGTIASAWAGGGGGGTTTGAYSSSAVGAGTAAYAKDGAVTTGLGDSVNTILTTPTFFPNARPTAFASGGVVAGEAGHEAVLPLARNSAGRLGVETIQSSGASGTSGGSIVIEQLNVTVQEKEGSASDQAEQISLAVRRSLETMVDTRLQRSRLPGGIMNPTAAQVAF